MLNIPQFYLEFRFY